VLQSRNMGRLAATRPRPERCCSRTKAAARAPAPMRTARAIRIFRHGARRTGPARSPRRRGDHTPASVSRGMQSCAEDSFRTRDRGDRCRTGVCMLVSRSSRIRVAALPERALFLASTGGEPGGCSATCARSFEPGSYREPLAEFDDAANDPSMHEPPLRRRGFPL
jgi:hypothetical protein